MVLVVQFEEVEEAFAQFEENNSKSISKYERRSSHWRDLALIASLLF
jgi:uncharacterized protein YhfF